MRRQLEVWHMLVAMGATLLTALVFAWNIAVAKGRDSERIEITQKQHGDRLTKLEVNAEIDRKVYNDRHELILNALFDIKLMLKDKEDRKQ